MNKWKGSFFICFALLVGTNIYWVYSLIDLGVSYSYQESELYYKNKSIEALGGLIVKGAKEYSQKDILHLLRKGHPNAFIVETENSIDFEGINFIFNNGVLTEVTG